MKRPTILVNDTKRQYINVGSDYPAHIGDHMARLELRGWDLRKDIVYVSYGIIPVGFVLM